MAKNNDCYFEGNIGKDPEKFGSVVKFSIAVWRGKEKKDIWLQVVCFGEVADKAKNSFFKGDKVKVWGRFDINEYKGKEYPQIIADRIAGTEELQKDKDFTTEEDDVPL